MNPHFNLGKVVMVTAIVCRVFKKDSVDSVHNVGSPKQKDKVSGEGDLLIL